MNTFRTHLLIFLLLVPAALSSGACATHRTTRTEIFQEEPRASASVPYVEDDKVVKEETTIEYDSGGGLFEIVGNILALPFRAIGALLSAIL